MRRNTLWIVGLGLLIALTSVAAAHSRDERETESGLDKITWLAGQWRESGSDRMTEELWMPPRGKLMLGLNRGTRKGRPASFEYLRIQETTEGTFLFASPSGKEAVRFELVEATKTKAVFTNPEHDFPQRIEYRLEDDKLIARTSGDTPGPSWTFDRVGNVR